MWLDEALAVTNENQLMGLRSLTLDDIQKQEAINYWRNRDIFELFAGTSFNDVEGSKASYLLAEMIFLKILNAPQKKVIAFLKAANPKDGGESAALDFLGKSILEFAEDVLGKGPWIPDI